MTQNTSPEEFPKKERVFKAEISREIWGGGQIYLVILTNVFCKSIVGQAPLLKHDKGTERLNKIWMLREERENIPN